MWQWFNLQFSFLCRSLLKINVTECWGRGYQWSSDLGRNCWNENLVPLFHFFYIYAYQCVVTVPGACGKFVNVCHAHLIIFHFAFIPSRSRKKFIIFLHIFHLPGGHSWWHCPVLTMYHSLSETRHPLQPEEQEVGIDPLLSYSHKPGGEFCMQIILRLLGNMAEGLQLALPALCVIL